MFELSKKAKRNARAQIKRNVRKIEKPKNVDGLNVTVINTTTSIRNNTNIIIFVIVVVTKKENKPPTFPVIFSKMKTTMTTLMMTLKSQSHSHESTIL